MASNEGLKSVCVVGLDGVPHSLLVDLAAKGIMPGITALLEKTTAHQMRVSIPEISAVSWTSFATGANPGVHGIFGFIDLKAGTYEQKFPNFRDCRARTIWDKVGAAGAKSVVINQPFTYPAKPMDGSLIAGFVALDLENGTYPQSLIPNLREIDYVIDIDTARCRSDHEQLWKELEDSLQGRRKAVALLWDQDWTFFEVIVTGTDRLFHYLWTAIEDENHQYHARAMDYFRNVDRFVAEVWDRFSAREGEDAVERFFALSDHGFCAINKEVYLNRWLMQNGYLQFPDEKPTALTTMLETSKAFCVDPGRIFINLKGKYPKGSVPVADAVAVATEIRERLSGLEFNGKLVMRKVFLRDEIYAGPFASQGPDLVALSHHGFDLKGTLASEEVFGNSDLTGMHTWDDAFVLTATQLEKPVFIWDLSEVILKKIGIG